MPKEIVIVGGANGVGKTTFAFRYKDEFGIDYLGADEIAERLSKDGIGTARIEAGKAFFDMLEKYRKRRQSIIIESTLSGLGLARRIRVFKNEKFSVHIVYVFLDDPALCRKRIAVRVKKGGHDIPPADVERRFFRSLKNLSNVYLPLADTWQIFYNGLQRPVEIAVGERDSTMVIDEEYYKLFLELSK